MKRLGFLLKDCMYVHCSLIYQHRLGSVLFLIYSTILFWTQKTKLERNIFPLKRKARLSGCKKEAKRANKATL